MAFHTHLTGPPKVEDFYSIFVKINLSKFLKLRSDCNIESICVEINLKREIWFINGSYNPSKNFILNYLECLNRIINQ